MYTQKTMCFNHYSFAFPTPYMESEHISVSLFSRHFFQPQRQLHCEGTTACPSHWSPKTYQNWELPCFHHRTTWQRASSLPPDMTDTAWLLFPVEDTWSHLFLHHGQNSTLWTLTIPACAEFHYMHPVIGLSRCTWHLLHRFFWRSKLELQPPCGTHSSDPLDSLDWDNLLIRLYPFVQYLWLIDVFFCAISVPPKGAKNVIVLVLDVLWSHNPMPSKGCLAIDPRKGRVSGHLATSRTLKPYLGSQDQTLTKPLVS